MQMNSGDTAFVLISAAMVMFMVPGLALFYGGMVRAKNVLATVLQSFFVLGIVSVLWVLIAYTLAFGPDVHGLIGNLSSRPDHSAHRFRYVPAILRRYHTGVDHWRVR
jgi:ammonium transporter, Amt family